ncbi:hypothetical protein vseg_014376 [Gypsophila vaccaria]
MSAASKLFALAEVSSHNTREDCWLIIHSKVYDVTKFLEEHPGGDEVLLASTGKDASDDFEDTGHSDSAKALMSQYYIGDIDKATIPTKKKYIPPKDPKYNPDKTSDFIIRLLQFLLPLLVLALAFGLRNYSSSSSS